MDFKADITESGAHELVDTLQQENDIVRIVDPVTREVLYWPAVEDAAARDAEGTPCLECNAVWGRTERCSNCSSLEAVRLMERTFKMELNNNRAFWVQSRPLVMDGTHCVMETVNDVTDGLLVEGGDRGTVTDLIDNLNGLLVTDALTSLFNRRFFEEFNLRLVELREAGTRVDVAMLDLDEMKDINDTYGHPAGDAVLKDIAGFLKLNFSSSDAHGEYYAIRYGGDEFIVISIGADAGAFEQAVRDRYRKMRRVCYFGDLQIPFSMSTGFSSSDECGWDWPALLDAADRSMYREKRAR